MKIKISPKVIEYKHLNSLKEVKTYGPSSNISVTHNLPFFGQNIFLYHNSNIYLYSAGKEKRVSPSDNVDGTILEGKTLLCQLSSSNTKTTRIFVTHNCFIFEQTFKEKIIQHLTNMRNVDKFIFNHVVDYLGNKKWAGERIKDDAYDIMNYLIASDSYRSQVEDILVDYQLFKSIMFVEVAL